ncbi:uncharacterized protein sS8_4269 [Methylocaldum marinum]|uniref:Uncharacterized protein n=1 Tax=Methylocaldum marinum TaxID=1432792 RepID=A0A250L1Q5_9GAMM|nr:hypothetical protein [Methylocaldum marinum]BBA36199.1 uncharacterized protein sS8_4269 [Methylocaldum marinum]
MAETGYTRSPRLVRGALVQLAEDVIGVVPNVIPFQYNPETLTRKLTPWNPFEVDQTGRGQIAPTAQPYDPKEAVTLEIHFDAADQLEESDPIAGQVGVADRIAAIEKLLLPSQGLLGDLLGAAAALAGAPQPPQRPTVPVALLVWGPGRILPVRVTDYSIDETTFLPSLHPLTAKISLSLEVLTPDVFRCESGPAIELAVAAYRFFRLQQSALALQYNARNAAQALSLLPF